jgi:hypothetical protein
MSAPRSAGPEYTGRHRRAGGPGLAGLPGRGGRAGAYGQPMPVPDGAPELNGVRGAGMAGGGMAGAGAVIPGPRPGAGLRPGTGPWPDAG